MNVSDEYTVPEAASYLNVSEETVRRNIRSKRLRAFRRGNSGSSPEMSLRSSLTATTPRRAKFEGCYRSWSL